MTTMTFLAEGGVCSAQGFKAGGVHCGLRKNKTKKDLALIVSDCRAAAAAVYTQNLVQGAPIAVTKRHLKDGYAQAMLCNSGNANTCNPDGEQVANAMCDMLTAASGIAADDIIIASTGVIGQPLPLEPIRLGMGPLVEATTYTGGDDAAQAIMTTDLVQKNCAVTFTLGGKTCTIGGIAKGSGMIHPNMATMLVFVTTDVAITPEMLQRCVSRDVNDTFNMISVDGDTSTNDMLSVMANGMAGNPVIDSENDDFAVFAQALRLVTEHLSKAIARDGEGATKLLGCRVQGARTVEAARQAAKAVIASSLVKTAMFGSDANWGRVLCALGYSGADVSIDTTRVDFVSAAGQLAVCRDGRGIPFSEDLAKVVLSEKEIMIEVAFEDGNETATAWGCDLSYDYVRINGDYRS